MKPKKFLPAIFAILLLTFMSVVKAQDFSPIGYWQISDEVSGKPKSIIQIWETSDQHLMGKVVKLFTQNIRCTTCNGNLHNQPILGMTILSDLKKNQDQWNDGKILDPDNGKTYNCTIRLTNNGKNLNVKGFTGLALFGTSQTWERVSVIT